MRGIVLFFFIFILVLNKLSANIILPTDPEVVGLPATPKKKMPPGVYKSWKDQQNRSVKDGIFVVHCLENSWGMDIATQEIYNKKNPDTLIDCKPTQFGFRREHLPISPDDFIEIYPEALSQRRNISGSVLAMNREKGFSLTSTFGKCGYIFSIPPECILFTQQQDSVIRATYSEDIEKIIVKKFGTDFQENLYSLEDLSLSLKTNGGPSKRQQFLNIPLTNEEVIEV